MVCRIIETVIATRAQNKQLQQLQNMQANGQNMSYNNNNGYCNACNSPYNNGYCGNGCYSNGYPTQAQGNQYDIVNGRRSPCRERREHRRDLRDIRRIEGGGYWGSRGPQVVNSFSTQPPMQGPPMQGPPMQGPPMQGPPMQGPPMQGAPMQGPPMASSQSPPSFRGEADRYYAGPEQEIPAGDAVPRAPASPGQCRWSPDDAPLPSYENTAQKAR